MTPDQKQILQEKKQKLNTEIDFKNFEQSSITPFIKILEELQKSDIEYYISEICGIRNEWKELLKQLFKKDSFVPYPLSEITISEDNSLIRELLKIYPNTHPVKYVPDLPVIAKYESNISKVLKSIIKKHLLSNQEVYLYYFQYAFMLQINISTLSENATEELFNLWLGDVIIFPQDYSYLITYSMEEEWQFSKKN